jgi:hypothetical protein
MQLESLFEGFGAGPVIACGAALGILMGVAGGESIDTTPLQRGKTFEQLVPDREFASSGDAWVDAGASMPDHYPVETRNGRVEVWELRSYILRRERPDAVFAYPEPVAGSEASIEGEPLEIEEDTAAATETAQLKTETVPGELEPVTVSYTQPYAPTSAL